MAQVGMIGLCFLMWPAWALSTQLDADRQIYLRVIATSVPVRAGPGGSYREIGRIGQGQVYQATDRSQNGAWFRIRLTRGYSGWVLADMVWPYELVDPGQLQSGRFFFENSALTDGTIDLTIASGLLDTGGLFMGRIGYRPSRPYLFEIVLGSAVRPGGGLLLYGMELAVTIAPWRRLVPFVSLGAGAATTYPNRSASLFTWSTKPYLAAGGGLLLSLWDLYALRIDVCQMILFGTDQTQSHIVGTGGLMLFF